MRDLGLSAAVPVVRLWFGIRHAVGWGQASLRQRFTVALAALCALSIVTGGALAVAGIGKPGPLVPPQLATANGAVAAEWIVQQVSPQATVSCDPAMCRQLQGNGFPAARLKPLGPTTHSPLGSDLIVSTPTVRHLFGTSLAAAYAPLVIAGFGSGSARVDVRVIAPDGAAAFKAQLASEHSFLVSAGTQLLRNQNIQATPAARAALLTGRVDSRLFSTLSVLSAQLPVQLVAFDDLSPGVDAAVPLRGAEISAASPAATSAILAFLHAQRGTYRPAVVAVARGAGGQSLVTVRFDAPGLMDAGAS